MCVFVYVRVCVCACVCVCVCVCVRCVRLDVSHKGGAPSPYGLLSRMDLSLAGKNSTKLLTGALGSGVWCWPSRAYSQSDACYRVHVVNSETGVATKHGRAAVIASICFCNGAVQGRVGVRASALRNVRGKKWTTRDPRVEIFSKIRYWM